MQSDLDGENASEIGPPLLPSQYLDAFLQSNRSLRGGTAFFTGHARSGVYLNNGCYHLLGSNLRMKPSVYQLHYLRILWDEEKAHHC
jgi:hypothetical protein